MSYSNGLLSYSKTTTIQWQRGPKGNDGVGFKLTSDGNYDLDNKKVFSLETQADVAFDADYDSYVIDMKSGVNKEYVNEYFLKKRQE